MSDNVTGVPIDEATAKDFMQVRAALVRRLGGANEALVWSRIYFRADPDYRGALEVNDETWWSASYELLSKETGLTPKQARDAANALVDGGFLERQQHSGRVYSYRPVIESHLPSRADRPIEVSDPTGTSIRPVGQMHLPSESLAPLLRQEDVKDPVAIAFDRCWSAWPSARRGARKKAESSFRTALKVVGMPKLEKLVLTAEAHADAWRSWAVSEQQFVPMLATWLNQERWTTPVPVRDRGKTVSRTSRAAAVIDMGRRMDDEQRRQVSG